VDQGSGEIREEEVRSTRGLRSSGDLERGYRLRGV